MTTIATSTSTTSLLASATSTAERECVTAVRGKYGSVPPDACNSYYNFVPDFAAAVAFCVLFGLATLFHFGLAIYFRKRFCWVVIVAALWETASFILRALGDRDQSKLIYIILSTLLLLLSPLLINAFAYMTAGRMIYCFLPEKRVWRIKATSLTKWFVWFDVVTFIVQAAGGSMLSNPDDQTAMKYGKDIYMAGTALQQFFIVIFTILIVIFHRRILQLEAGGIIHPDTRWKRLTYTLYAVLALITMRICFRLAEFADGTEMNNKLVTSEYYVLMLDALPMFLALLLLLIVHPGMVLVGPESEFPRYSRKEKKEMKRQAKEEKKQRKHKRRISRSHGGSRNRVVEGNMHSGSDVEMFQMERRN